MASRSSKPMSARPVPVEGAFDAVLNLACPASPADFGPLALEILDVGSRGVANLLDLAARSGARFLQASTSEVYGEPLVHPQPETLLGQRQPDRPPVGLRRGQALRGGAHHGLPPPPRPGGPHRPDLQHLRSGMRLDDGRVVTNFVTQAIRGEPLTVYGDGPRPAASATWTTWSTGLAGPARLGLCKARSTSATTTSAPCSRWLSWCSSCRGRPRASCSPPGPPTTPTCAAPTSPGLARSWAGSPPPCSATAWHRTIEWFTNRLGR